MTGMLASVSNLEEARSVHACGANIIDLKDPSQGALGAVDHNIATHVVNEMQGCCPISATIGDIPMQADRIEQAVLNMAKTGVDFIKVGLFADHIDPDFLGMLDHCHRNHLRIVLVVFADTRPDIPALIGKLQRSSLAGLMLDTKNKQAGSLTANMNSDEISTFVTMARQRGWLTGLAGSLQPMDVPVLLQHQPDYLGFRGALCAHSDRTAILDTEKVIQIRTLIPRQSTALLRDLEAV